MANDTPIDDSKEIIYIALSNSFVSYTKSLEEEDFDPNEKDVVEYLIKRHQELLDKYKEDITKDSFIPRPRWKD